jgi:hypothetical protein
MSMSSARTWDGEEDSFEYHGIAVTRVQGATITASGEPARASYTWHFRIEPNQYCVESAAAAKAKISEILATTR